MEELTPDKLEAIARRIDEAAAEYREVAKKMRESGIASISAGGFDTLHKATLPRLESPVGSARRALKAMISQSQYSQAKTDVENAEKLLTDKRKKGKKP